MDERIETYRAIKVKLCKILKTVEYCCICFENDTILKSTNDFICASNWEGHHYITIKNMMSTIFGENTSCPTSIDFICSSCLEEVMSSYLFIYNTRRTSEIVDIYITQLNITIDQIQKSVDVTDEMSPTAFVIEDPPCLVTITGNQEKEIRKETIAICDYCNADFKSLDLLTKHIDSNHLKLDIKENSCRCKRKLCKHTKYIKHYNHQKDKGIKNIQCLDCKKVFFKKKLYLRHVNKKHLKLRSYKCNLCLKDFPSKFSLEHHKKLLHSTVKSCDYCCKEFIDMKKLHHHAELCKNKEKSYKCDHCPASFNSELMLKRHVKRHLNIYACDSCLRTFTNQFSLKQHKRQHCIRNSDHICLYCGFVFENNLEKKHHIAQHNPYDKPYCKNCDRHFDTTEDFNNHIDSIRHKINKFTCEHCNYKSATLFGLEAHVNRYHLKVMPYKCNQCDKKFTVITHLKLHLKTHRKDRRHQCHICTKMFCGSMALKKHIRLHTGERPYLCDECGEGFVSSSLRGDHKARKHSKEKTVKCPFCDYMFYTARDMREHFKNNHWKVKGEKFDVRKVKGLRPEDLELFRDRRMLIL